MAKLFYLIIGTLSLGVGITGIFIPGLPTALLIILTAGLYMRSSDKLYRQLISNIYLSSLLLFMNSLALKIVVTWG